MQVGNHRRWGYKPTSVRYSPDGTKIAVGYENQEIKVVKGDSGYWEIRTVVTNLGKVYSVDFSDNSELLLACGENKKFQVWNVSNNYNSVGGDFDVGQIIWSCRFASDNSVGVGLENGKVNIYSTSYSSPATSVYSPSGSGKAISLEFKYGTQSFAVANDNSRGYYSNHTSALFMGSGAQRAAAYSRTTDYFMFGGEDEKVRIYEGPTNTLAFTLT